MIKKEMNIGETVRNYPEIAMVFIEAGMHCIGCHVSSYETIEEGAKMHGLSDKEIDKMIDRANTIIKNSKKKPLKKPNKKSKKSKKR